jgi:hypothetical protein
MTFELRNPALLYNLRVQRGRDLPSIHGGQKIPDCGR